MVCLQPSLFVSRTKDDPSYDIDLEKHPEMLGKKFIGWIGLFLASFFAGKNIFWRKRGFDPLKGHHANVSWPSFFHCFLLKKMQVTSRWKRKRKANNKTRSVEWVRLWGSESWQEVRIAWLNRKIIERFGPYHRWIHGFIYLLICHELVHEETSFIENDHCSSYSWIHTSKNKQARV